MSAAWTCAQISHLRTLIAQGHSAQQISVILDRKRKAVLATAKRHNLGPWLSVAGIQQKNEADEAIPADFEEYWQDHSLMDCARHYQRGPATVHRWAKRKGLKRGSSFRTSRSGSDVVPKDFHRFAGILTIAELMEKYGRGKCTIVKWRKEVGANVARFVKPNAYATAPVDRPHRDASRAGLAADYLRRFGPVVRCDAKGVYDASGTHWRRNSSVLTAAEVIERAESNGWQPDAWKQVQAA